MRYPVRLLQGEPRFDSLGVLKLRCSSGVPINERIYAQAQIGRTQDVVFARIWSFETAPDPQAVLSVVFVNGAHSLVLSATARGEATVVADHRPLPEAMVAYAISGEDLQGEYWGVVMMISARAFFEALGTDEHSLPAVLTGNVLREHPAVSSAVPDGELLEWELRRPNTESEGF